MGPENILGSGFYIFPMICFVMIIICAVLVSRGVIKPPWQSNSNRQSNENSESALDILQKRFANGEITREEFIQIKKDLLS